MVAVDFKGSTYHWKLSSLSYDFFLCTTNMYNSTWEPHNIKKKGGGKRGKKGGELNGGKKEGKSVKKG